MDKQLNILWLPGWFPSKVDFLTGDFIERHAKAVSGLARITVIYVAKDVQLQGIKDQILKEQTGRLTIYRGYYPGKKERNIFSKINSVVRYYRVLFKIYTHAKGEQESFDLCHVHVPLKQGLLAIWLKWKRKINFVVSEQNSWYMPGDKSFFSQPFFLRWIIKQTFHQSSGIHVVSGSLGEELNKCIYIRRSYVVIPNVVNTDVFKQEINSDQQNTDSINFIVVTGNTWHKNTDGVIRAFTSFIRKGYNAKLHIVGPNVDELELLVKEMGSGDHIVFYGAISNERVAEITQRSDAMIFFTRYETFGCVMAEALCCGVPVIASRLPVLQENLDEGINALFVQSENESDLADKLSWFAQRKNTFDANSIARAAVEKYNYHTVALQFMEFYNKSINFSAQ